MSNNNQILEQIVLATDFQLNKKILKEKIQTELHLPHNGGLFLVTPELISFLSTWPYSVLYLEDVYQNPVRVDRAELLAQAQEHYQRVMNDWHIQYDKLRKIRKI